MMQRPEGAGGPQADRLAALHRMSGALTHDFNNLLGVILGANERLAEELPEGSEAQKLALIGLEAAERGAELLRRALSLAHAEAPEPQPVDCAEVLESLRSLARQAVAPSVRLNIRAPGSPLQFTGDRTGLEMALLNLCLNAGQAMDGDGDISLRVSGTTLSVAEARRLGLARGAYVAFCVRDTGKGMSPQTLARATDPLFTTRPTGTGLGLSSVADFARSAGGALALQSREREGTTATLYLPLAHAVETAAAA